MTHPDINRARGLIAWAGVILGIIAILISLRVGQIGSEKTANVVRGLQTSTCQRQHEAAKQWDLVLGVLTDVAEKATPGSSKTPGFVELVNRTRKIYSTFPACKLPSP